MNKNNSSELKNKEPVPCMEIVTINHLNDDCLINIFEYLTIKQKLMLELVSKRWNGVAKRSWACEKNFDLQSFAFDCGFFTDNKNENTNYIINILDRCGKYLQKVTLYSYKFDHLEYSPILKKLSEHGSNIKNLIIKDFHNRFAERDLKLFFSKVNLHSLEIFGLFVNGDCLTTLNTNCIKEITITDISMNYLILLDFFSNLTNLTKVKINSNDVTRNTVNNIVYALQESKCQNISDFSIVQEQEHSDFRKNLVALIARQKYICNLYLGNVLIDEKLIGIIPSEHLTTLQLSFTENENLLKFYHFENLSTLISRNSCLTKYDWQNLSTALYVKEICIDWSEDLLMFEKPVSCFKNLQYLETLQIRHSQHTICIDILMEDILSCKSLKQLLLSNCTFKSKALKNVNTIPNIIKFKAGSPHYSDRALENFVGKAPKLQELDISHYLELTTSLIHRIAKVKKNRGDDHILKISYAHCPELHKLKKEPSLILLYKKIVFCKKKIIFNDLD